MQLEFEHNGRRHSFQLNNGTTVIGRADDCDLVLTARGISKKHALIEKEDDFIEIFDEGSQNGIQVNGVAVKTRILAPGDVIQVGAVSLFLQNPQQPVRPRVPTGSMSGSVAQSRSQSAIQQRPPAAHDPLLNPQIPSNPLLNRFQLRDLNNGQIWVLSRQLETLGSKEKNTILLDGDGLSRYHCKVEIRGDHWAIKDLDSRNGVFFAPNLDAPEQQVQDQALAPGCVLRVGSVEMIFEPRGAHLNPEPPPMAAAEVQTSADELEAVGETNIKPMLGAVVALVLLVVAFVAFGTGGGGGTNNNNGEVEAFESYEEAIVYVVEKLDANELTVARKVMGTVEQNFSDRKSAPLLSTIVWAWEKKDTPDKFPWDKFVNALVKLQELNVPLPVDRFARKHEPKARIEQSSFHALSAAKEARKEALEWKSKQDTLKATASYRKALRYLSTIPAVSEFLKEGKKLYTDIREEAYANLYDQAETLRAAKDWPAARRLYEKARPYAPDKEARGVVAKKIAECSGNLYDEGSYSRAVEIIQKRKVKRYPEALAMLKKVAESGSKISASAKKWYEYGSADLKARRATAAYMQGKGELALKLLNETLASPALKGSSKSALQKRKELWTQVINAYDLGNDLVSKGRVRSARDRFRFVMQTVRSDNNVYRRLAESKLKELESQKNLTPDQLLDRARKALTEERWQDGMGILERVKATTEGSKVYSSKIRALVDVLERKKDLAKRIRKVVLKRERENYANARIIALLLKEYLPFSDKRRVMALDVIKRLGVK